MDKDEASDTYIAQICNLYNRDVKNVLHTLTQDMLSSQIKFLLVTTSSLSIFVFTSAISSEMQFMLSLCGNLHYK